MQVTLRSLVGRAIFLITAVLITGRDHQAADSARPGGARRRGVLGDLPRLTTGPSIYEHLLAHRDAAGRLDGEGARLPDEDDGPKSGLRWVAGGLDGTFSHHTRGGHDRDGRSGPIAALVAKAARKPSKKNLGRLYEAVADDGVLNYLDPMIDELVERYQPGAEEVYEVGRWLATTATVRGAVKVGIALVGAAGPYRTTSDDDVAMLRVLGAHEELTLYAAVALGHCLENPERELWALAQTVDGWGRVHCVERLAQTEDEAIKAWMLREGYRNSVTVEYLAWTAATTGGLLEALRGDGVDRQLLTAAGEILGTLAGAVIHGGPGEDMDDYADGAAAVEAYLGHMRQRAETIQDFSDVAAVRDFLTHEAMDWEARVAAGWTTSRREAFEACCAEILGRDEWHDRITVGLLSDDEAEFRRAEHAARQRGMDTYDALIDRIRRDPYGSWWFMAWNQASDGRAGQLADLAGELLPLDDIVGELADEMGAGPGWEPHRALDWTLQALHGHPGVGGDLLLVGLRCPVTRNRNMALRALTEWPRSTWPEGAAELARHLASADPNERTRQNAHDALSAAS